MCGLVGMVGNIDYAHENAYKRLLELDVTRGKDSTGSFVVRRGGYSELVKAVGTTWDLYENVKFKQHLVGINRVLLGHNRAATKGGITKHTAHPFEFDSLVGAHNGTLVQQHLLDDSTKYAVDSENLYHHMDKNGLDDTLSKLRGAYALTWFDTNTNTMNFIRNEQRTLFYTYTDSDVLVWASEKWMIEVALSKYKITHGEVMDFSIHHHHSLDINIDTFQTKEILGKMHIRSKESLLPKKITPNTSKRGAAFGSNRHDRSADGNVTPIKKNQALLGHQSKKSSKEVFEILSGYVGHYEDFTVSHLVYSPIPYASCKLSCDNSIEVRVYKSNGCTDLWNELRDGVGETFNAKVKKATVVDVDEYLLIDHRDIQKKAGKIDSETEEVFPVECGVLVSKKEFEEVTKKGCAMCCSPVLASDAEDLTWLAGNEFICLDCKPILSHPEYEGLALSYH